jgi:NTP pyrophosphatase (non-canonical NTP hydrolase)
MEVEPPYYLGQSSNLPDDKLKKVEQELADKLIYLVRLADKLDIDLIDSLLRL